MDEIWKAVEIDGKPTRYEVSNFGRVRYTHVLKLPLSNLGYPRVTIMCERKQYRKHVHALVLEAFVGPRVEPLIARHIDGIKTNNHITNLEWNTKSVNMMDTIKHTGAPWLRGSKNPNARLNEKVVAEIRANHNGLKGKQNNAKELAKKYNVSITNMGAILRRQTWK